MQKKLRELSVVDAANIVSKWLEDISPELRVEFIHTLIPILEKYDLETGERK